MGRLVSNVILSSRYLVTRCLLSPPLHWDLGLVVGRVGSPWLGHLVQVGWLVRVVLVRLGQPLVRMILVLVLLGAGVLALDGDGRGGGLEVGVGEGGRRGGVLVGPLRGQGVVSLVRGG